MPEISRFYGIIICMYVIDKEHPPQHIHIKYGEYEAVMELENLNIVQGAVPKKCRQLVHFCNRDVAYETQSGRQKNTGPTTDGL